jgi:MFS family permease
LNDPTSRARPPRALLPREPWRRNQLAITVAAAMVFLGFTLVMPFLPFFVESLGVRGTAAIAAWSGLLLTVSPLIAALLGPFWGRLADRVGMKIMVQRVLFTITLQWALMYFVTSVWQVLGLRVVLGLFSGFGTMSVALVTHGCPRERIGRAVGTLQATQILSTAVGPFLGGILGDVIGIRPTFLVTFVLCAAAFVLVMAVYRDTAHDGEAAVRHAAAAMRHDGEAARRDAVEARRSAPMPRAATGPREAETPVMVTEAGPVSTGVRAVVTEPAGGAGRTGASIRDLLRLPLILPLLPILFFVNAVDRSLSLIVPLVLAEILGPGPGVVATTGVVVSAGAFASAASAYLLGRGAAGRAPIRLLLWSLAGGCLAIAPLALCRSVPIFGALRVLLGLAVGGAATLAYTLGGEVIPGAVRASGYGLLSSVAMLGGSMGPILSGLLASIDLRAPFVAGGILYLAMTLHVALLTRRWGPRTAAAHGRPSEGRP